MSASHHTNIKTKSQDVICEHSEQLFRHKWSVQSSSSFNEESKTIAHNDVQGLCNAGCPSVRPSVCHVAAAQELLLHSPVAGNWAVVARRPQPAAWCSAANAGSAMFTAKVHGWTQTCFITERSTRSTKYCQMSMTFCQTMRPEYIIAPYCW